MAADPEPVQVDLGRHPHPLPVRPEPEERADPDADIDRDDVLDLGRQAEGVVAEPEDGVLDQQANAVQDEEHDAFARRARALAVAEAPVPVPDEGDDRRHDRRDRDGGQRAEPERMQRDEDEIGDADPDQADDQELGTLVEQVPGTLINASELLDGPERRTGTAQLGFPASSPVEGASSAWPGATVSAGTSDSCPSGAGRGAAHTHLRYDQNLNSVPSTMPTLFATRFDSLPVSPRP